MCFSPLTAPLACQSGLDERTLHELDRVRYLLDDAVCVRLRAKRAYEPFSPWCSHHPRSHTDTSASPLQTFSETYVAKYKIVGRYVPVPVEAPQGTA